MLVWALIFVVITSGMVVSHSLRLASSRSEFDALLDRKVLARTVAKSGVVDALSWFRTRPTQPVTQFEPVFDPYGDPPRFDTLDAAMGLVREFEIRGNLWGRYELRRDDLHDISAERGVVGSGKVWSMQARSYVYRVVDPEKDFDAPPNRIVAADKVDTEICAFGLVLPALSPVIGQDPAGVVINRNVIINGGSSPGLAHGDGPVDSKDYSNPTTRPIVDIIDDVVALPPAPFLLSVDPILSPLAQITGTPATLRQTSMAVDVSRIFGVGAEFLRAFADVVVSDGSGLNKLGDVAGQIVFIPGDLVIDQGVTVENAAIVVQGSLAVPSNPDPTLIRGMLYVEGDAKILGNFTLEGTLIAKHRLELGLSSGGPPVVISSSPTVMSKLQDALRQYRTRRGTLGR